MDSKKKHRLDINGLRGVAILMVILFHAFPDIVVNGFIGVDIFFVISGYLICSIIIFEIESSQFSVINFYQRRIKRLFPSLITILIFSSFAGWYFLLSDEYLSLNYHISAASVFLSNFLLSSEVHYFNSTSELKPLLHLWSLAVEEQFYIFCPIMFIIFIKKLRYMIPLIILFLFLSFTFNVLEIKSSHIDIFYSPFSRSWEILVGCLLALLSQHKNLKCGRILCNIFSLMGFLSIALSLVLMKEYDHFPGWWAILPVLGTFLLILSGEEAWFNKKILSSKTLVLIGLISYPLYLWHWPLLSISRIVFMDDLNISHKIFLLILSFVLAYSTYRFLEEPIRKNISPQKSSRVVLVLIITLLTIGGINFFNYNARLFQSKFSKVSKKYQIGFKEDRRTLTDEYNKLFREECNFHYLEKKHERPNPSCVKPSTHNTIFLWGDSHAQHLSPGLNHYFSSKSYSLLQIASSACPPQITEKNDNFCDRANQMALKNILLLKPRLVIIAQRGDYDRKNLEEIIDVLRKQNINLVIVGPTPQWKTDIPKIVLRRYVYFNRDVPTYLNFAIKTKIFDRDKKLINDMKNFSHIRYISLIDKLCNDAGCMIKMGESLPQDLMMFDNEHFTIRGSHYVVDQVIGPAINDLI